MILDSGGHNYDTWAREVQPPWTGWWAAAHAVSARRAARRGYAVRNASISVTRATGVSCIG